MLFRPHQIKPAQTDLWLWKLTRQRTRAIAEARTALAILDRFRDWPDFDWADDLAREYRRVLGDLEAIDPENLPTREELGLIAVRLHLLDQGMQRMAKTAADPMSEGLTPLSKEPT